MIGVFFLPHDISYVENFIILQPVIGVSGTHSTIFKPLFFPYAESLFKKHRQNRKTFLKKLVSLSYKTNF